MFQRTNPYYIWLIATVESCSLQPAEVREPEIIARDVRTYSVIVGKIDETILSRIQVSLKIETPDSKGQKQIWKMLFGTFMSRYPDFVVDEGVEKYATSSMSKKNLGLSDREMRNGI